jgi:small RNA 2'-O-methyltransferase
VRALFVFFRLTLISQSIEHLPIQTVPFFAPILLGVYHPHLLLITTPSYTFNARFTAPRSNKRNGFTDPTGRTDRVFRHHDHQFEWTVEEFQDYCDKAAEEWAYDVTCSTIGYAMEKDEWGRDEQLGGATQVAEFRRRNGEAFAKARAEKSQAWLEKANALPEHRLLATHHHAIHPKSRQPVSSHEIGDAVKSVMVSRREVFTRMEDFWFTDISVLCGGWIELLTQAIEGHAQLKLHKEDETKRRTWRVELVGGVQSPSLEELNREAEIGQNYFPEVSGEWETEARSVSSRRSTYDAEADDEGSAGLPSPPQWEHADDSNRWGNGRSDWTRSEGEGQPETIEELDEPPEEHDLQHRYPY